MENVNQELKELNRLIKKEGIKKTWLAKEIFPRVKKSTREVKLSYILNGKRTPKNIQQIITKANNAITSRVS